MIVDTADLALQIGVKAFIKNRAGKYLMLLRAKPYEGETKCKWDIPGGRIKLRETLGDALAREVKEETGMKLSGIPKIIYAQDILRSEKKHVVRLTYIAKASGNIKLEAAVHSEYAWFTLREIKKLYHDSYLTPVLGLL